MKLKSKLSIFLLLVLFVNSYNIIAQIMPSNNFKYKPQIFDSLDNNLNYRNFGYLTNTYFNAEFLLTNNSFRNEKDRVYRLNGILEVYRNNRDIIAFNLSNELNANSLNDIGFNPRQSIWEENLTYLHNFGTYNSKYYMANVSLFHRCKHEVDNSDSPEGDATKPDYIPTKRVIILTGINTGLTVSNTRYQINKGEDIKNQEIYTNKLRYFIKGDLEYYLFSSDIRQPNDSITYDWSNLIASSRINLRLNYNIYKDIHIFNSNELTLFWFKEVGAKSNYKIEIGSSIQTKGISLDVFFINQYIFDELAFINQNPSNFIGLGVRLLDINFF